MSTTMNNQTEGNNQAANPKIWGLMEDTKMEITNIGSTGQLNNSRNTAKSNLIKTIGVMAMGAMLATSVFMSGSTASADGANVPLTKEQVTQVENWDGYADARDIVSNVRLLDSDFDAYVDARDIPNSQTGLTFSAKLLQLDSDFDTVMDARDILVFKSGINSSPKLSVSNGGSMGNWDAYRDARDVLPRISQIDSDFDAYVDARDIPNSQTGLTFSAKLVQVDSDFDTVMDARDILVSKSGIKYSSKLSISNSGAMGN